MATGHVLRLREPQERLSACADMIEVLDRAHDPELDELCAASQLDRFRRVEQRELRLQGERLDVCVVLARVRRPLTPLELALRLEREAFVELEVQHGAARRREREGSSRAVHPPAPCRVRSAATAPCSGSSPIAAPEHASSYTTVEDDLVPERPAALGHRVAPPPVEIAAHVER